MKMNGLTVLGILVVGLGGFGVYSAVMRFGKPDVEMRDVTTKGTITRVYGTALSHRLTGVELNRQFDLDYKFTAEDGKEYHDSDIIDESEFGTLKEGDEITVRYHSHNPIVSASVPYGNYTSVAYMPKATAQFRFFFSLGTCGIGGLILLLAFMDQRQPEESNSVMAAQF